ncbi:MAG: gamma-glutamyltransferase [Enterobacterales bacterium]|nr:gamma-glutamyltransferase [Enterobacterales bacterium]
MVKKMVSIVIGIFISFASLIGANENNNYTGRNPIPIIASMQTAQPVWAKHGMVVSVNRLATQVGVDILKQGGNAVDAAVAVGFALAVTYPRAGNLGGGGFMLIHLSANQQNKQVAKTIAIDYREMAPNKAQKDMFLNANGKVIKNRSLFHGASSGVPGSVMGMALALKNYGSLPLSLVIQPAIELAEKGFVVSYDFSGSLENKKQRLQKWASSKKVFYHKDGSSYQPGEQFIQGDLAKTLKLIAKQGSAGFYRGEVAHKVVDSIQQAGGIMSLEDLTKYQAIIRKPVSTNYRGYQVYSMPPPSSGGIHLIQLLNILENSDRRALGHNTAASIHQMTEAMKYVYADRSEYLGDSDFYPVPQKALLSKAYAKQIYNNISADKIVPSEAIKPGHLAPYESNQTTHYSVIDRWGNSVSTTTTLNFSYGSGLVAEGTGVLMNNEMDDFSSKPGVPNAYGLLGGKANAIAAGKRPLSAMTPSIVLKQGKPFLVTGSPGGSRIITTTLQIILNVIDHQMNIAEATNASRVHHQWYPDEIRVEKGLSQDTISLLKAMGHPIVVKSAMGSTQSIMVTEQGYWGAADPRSRDAQAAGY